MTTPATTSAQFVKLINQGFADLKSRDMKPVPVAFLGSEGSFTCDAAKKYFGDAGQPIIPKGYPSFESVFKAVSSGDVYAGVVPIESTWSGSFARCYDSLLRHKNVSIAGELSVLDAHCLCALRGSSKADIRIVHTHPDMFEQCSGFLEKLGRKGEVDLDLDLVSEIDSATACAKVAKLNDKKRAVICSPSAAKLHNLQVIESGVANDANIASRYIVVGRELNAKYGGKSLTETKAKECSKEPFQIEALKKELGASTEDATNGGSRSGTLKSTIAVAMHNEAQGLFKVLSCFALRGINVTKLDSRPASSVLGTILDDSLHWEYVFFIDFEPRNEKVVQTVVANIREYTASVRVLGVYMANLNKGKVRPSQFLDLDVFPS
ncbi:hypothetical protein AAMO2058_000298900 [Amorphochlora amoebiformis]